MARVVVVAQCKDQGKWEAGFKTHRELFKTYGISEPVSYGMGEANHVVACFETNDLATFMKAMDSPETKAAMESDGLVMDSVSVFVLDKELSV
ncbi:MAG TPA: hypothetical protein VKR56_14140 [Candidatus Cybelea sp.]|nr:hypothetical protein [Candidatus Cybelea sp.]